jgi:VWFA-related protein
MAALALLLATALPALATKTVTVEQLQQVLTAARNQPDADLAQQLSDLELTERLNPVKLAQLRAAMPGDKSQQALTAVADRAEFLNLPPGEIPKIPQPTPSEQRQMMSLVVTYVTKNIHQLPNFFATRETTRFEDRPQANFSYLPLHFVGSSARSVVYRDGQEIAESAQGKLVKGEGKEQGLVSWGEFGPILSIVLLDAAQSKLAWSHWEQGSNGPEAVFSYEVPSQKSHYLVQSQDGSTTDAHQDPGTSSRNRPQLQNGNGYDATDSSNQFRERPGYHGEMKIDPASGTILRVTVDAELALGDPLTKAALMVEYGTVDIGGKAVTCPTRSVALSMVRYGHATTFAHSILDHDPLKTFLNDVEFSQYHQLRSEMRILADGETPSPPDAPATSTALQPAPSPEPAKPAEPTSPTNVAANPPAPAEIATNLPSPTATESAVSTPATTPAEPEISVTAASNLPDTPIHSTVPQPGAFVLKVTSRLVDVGVVVVDKKGQPVTGLNAADFAVYDNGRRQEVKFFNSYAVNGNPAAAQPTASSTPDSKPASPVRTYSNQADSGGAVSTANSTVSNSIAATTNTTVLLIDESHIAWTDLSNARNQILKFLQGLGPGERVGLYTISGRGFRVLTEVTSDHAAVIARLKKWTPTAQSASNGQEDETRNRQQFETVHNATDLNSVNGNQTDAPDGQTPIDPQLLTMGSNPGRASLIVLLGVARHLASIPGHKSLVWIASDNVLVDWNDQSVGVDKNTTTVDSFALHAQEAMNEAHVAAYPLDVSQLEAGGIGADSGNRNVELDPTNIANSAPGGGAREMDAGRTKASMLQDLRPIQGPIRQVADATGGRIIRRSGDLAAELGSIVQDGHATYQVGFYPDTPADGQYHTVMLKLVDKKGLSIRGRSGYLYAKEPTTLKERFRQAIWQPSDAAEIKVTATVDGGQANPNLKINVATTDLAPELRGARWWDKLDIFFVQRDDAGMRADLEGQTLGLSLKQATYDKLVTDGVPFEHAVTLKPGTGSLRVLVVDENSGRMGSVTLPATAFMPQ